MQRSAVIQLLRQPLVSVSSRWFSAQAKPQPTGASAAASEPVDPEWHSALPFSKIPGPSTWEAFRRFSKGGRYHDINLKELHRRLREDYGDIIYLKGSLGRRDIVLTFKPEDFEKVFRTEGPWPMRRGFDSLVYFRNEVRPDVFKDQGGLVTEQGEPWQKMRHAVNPVMMQPKTIALYISKVDEVAREFMHIVDELLDSKHELPADFDQWLNRWALETIGVLALDTRLGVLERNQTEEAKSYIKLVQQMFALTYQLDFLPSIWKYYKTSTFHELMRVCDELTNLVMIKINEGIVRMEKNPTAVENQSVLEKLLKIDKHVAVVMANDMLLAGIDTTSSGSVGILYCLAKNPEKQRILRDELRTILPNKDSPLTPENMRNLPYLRACIKEGIRMFPPTSGNFRASGRDIVLQGYRIPKGTDIAMAALVLMNDPAIFRRANEFLPERWLNDRESDIPSGKEVNPFVYLPFGFGARTCVGRRMAMMEMEIFISRVIRRYEARWNYDELKIKSSAINVPSNPLQFELRSVD